uniref:Uncharacterized protein n=1 Tax=Panagrellus redivivus TaxID=6233 RepID=A0A7E4UZQ1_PANRE
MLFAVDVDQRGKVGPSDRRHTAMKGTKKGRSQGEEQSSDRRSQCVERLARLVCPTKSGRDNEMVPASLKNAFSMEILRLGGKEAPTAGNKVMHIDLNKTMSLTWVWLQATEGLAVLK